MITTTLGKIHALTSRIRNPLIKINLFTLNLLKKGSFDSTFWTLVMTGSIGMAIPIAFLSVTSHLFRQLFLSNSLPQ